MAIQSLGTAASSRPSPPDRTESGSSVVANRLSGSSHAGATNGAASLQNAQASGVETRDAVKRTDDAPTLEQVNQAVQNINKSLQSLHQDLEFSVDSDSKRTVVKVVDQKTKEVIRQIPSKETLEIAKALDTVKGLLITQQA